MMIATVTMVPMAALIARIIMVNDEFCCCTHDTHHKGVGVIVLQAILSLEAEMLLVILLYCS